MEAGTLTLREGVPIKVELTENYNLRLTDEAVNTYIYINLSDAEANQIEQVVIKSLIKRGIILDREGTNG